MNTADEHWIIWQEIGCSCLLIQKAKYALMKAMVLCSPRVKKTKTKPKTITAITAKNTTRNVFLSTGIL